MPGEYGWMEKCGADSKIRLGKSGLGSLDVGMWLGRCGGEVWMEKCAWGVWVGSVNGDVWMVECGWGSVDGGVWMGSVAWEVWLGKWAVEVWMWQCGWGSAAWEV